ncbi:hypothetical protein ACWOAH_02305 [Vagococcus vulneris]|uniref:Uncharacterized protein n=1 Tax=Vagococcus vulneris TaxID=1977869 RepID=A0A430A154_9ENTE|nr:hypothetical protein [Vagococcus vulneris]RSU00104.1 hypothetical protein CBF37_02050 [Vagococcus vulneris]
MNYFRFHLKAALKSKYTYLPFALGLILISVCLYFNSSNYNTTGLIANLNMSNTSTEKTTEVLKKELASLEDKKSVDYVNIEKSIKYNEYRIKKNNEILSYAKKNNWSSAYKILIEITEEDKKNTIDDKNVSPELKKSIQRDLLFYQELQRKNIDYQDPEFPTKGITFTLWILARIIPVMVSIFIIFILTQIFSNMFYENINKYSLLPYSKVKNMSNSLTLGGIVSLFILAINLVLPFGIASLIFGMGDSNFPIQSSKIGDNSIYFQDAKNVIGLSIVLSLLAVIFCMLMTYLINYLIRNQLTSLFVSLLVIIAPLLLLNTVQPLQKISHLLPTTYISSVSVVTGITAEQINNVNVTFSMGIKVTIAGIIVLLATISCTQLKLKKY